MVEFLHLDCFMQCLMTTVCNFFWSAPLIWCYNDCWSSPINPHSVHNCTVFSSPPNSPIIHSPLSYIHLPLTPLTYILPHLTYTPPGLLLQSYFIHRYIIIKYIYRNGQVGFVIKPTNYYGSFSTTMVSVHYLLKLSFEKICVFHWIHIISICI